MAELLRCCVAFAGLLYMHFACGIAMPSSEQVGRGGNLDDKQSEAIHVALF